MSRLVTAPLCSGTETMWKCNNMVIQWDSWCIRRTWRLIIPRLIISVHYSWTYIHVKLMPSWRRIASYNLQLLVCGNIQI